MSQQVRPKILNGKTGIGNFGVAVMPDGTTDTLRVLIKPDGFHFEAYDFDDLVLPSVALHSPSGSQYTIGFDDTGALSINGAKYVVPTNQTDETIAGDKTFTGTVTSTNPINGALSTRSSAFTDFNDVARNMVKYAGSWVISTQSIANSPLQNYYTATITPGFSGGGDGYIELVPFANGSAKKYIAIVGSRTLSAWKSFAFDDDVVHKTGTETIDGDKQFTGKTDLVGGLKLTSATGVAYDVVVDDNGVIKTMKEKPQNGQIDYKS